MTDFEIRIPGRNKDPIQKSNGAVIKNIIRSLYLELLKEE